MVNEEYFMNQLGHTRSDIRYMRRLDERIKRKEMGQREPFFIVTLGRYFLDASLDIVDKFSEEN